MLRTIFIIAICLSGVVKAQTAPQQACGTEEHRAFDFWLGDWDVTLPDQSLAGKNSITVEHNGCVIHEQWQSSTSNFTGSSFNFYDTSKQKWRQLWLDSQGGVLELEGNRVANKMILATASQADANGNASYHQITWTYNDDGSVRQVWETFVEGQEPATVFDGLYQKSSE